MQLTEQNIQAYQEIYRRKFGKEVSTEQASEQGLKLVLLVQEITQSYQKN